MEDGSEGDAISPWSVALFRSLKAGMGTKLNTPRLRKITVSVGCVVFLGTAIWIATSPVSVSI